MLVWFSWGFLLHWNFSSKLGPNGQFLAQKSYGCKEFVNHELLAHVCNQSSSNSVLPETSCNCWHFGDVSLVLTEFLQATLYFIWVQEKRRTFGNSTEMCHWCWQIKSNLLHILFKFQEKFRKFWVSLPLCLLWFTNQNILWKAIVNVWSGGGISSGDHRNWLSCSLIHDFSKHIIDQLLTKKIVQSNRSRIN